LNGSDSATADSRYEMGREVYQTPW